MTASKSFIEDISYVYIIKSDGNEYTTDKITDVYNYCGEMKDRDHIVCHALCSCSRIEIPYFPIYRLYLYDPSDFDEYIIYRSYNNNDSEIMGSDLTYYEKLELYNSYLYYKNKQCSAPDMIGKYYTLLYHIFENYDLMLFHNYDINYAINTGQEKEHIEEIEKQLLDEEMDKDHQIRDFFGDDYNRFLDTLE